MCRLTRSYRAFAASMRSPGRSFPFSRVAAGLPPTGTLASGLRKHGGLLGRERHAVDPAAYLLSGNAVSDRDRDGAVGPGLRLGVEEFVAELRLRRVPELARRLLGDDLHLLHGVGRGGRQPDAGR